MNTQAPSRLIVDARYNMTACGEAFLVALNDAGRWQLFDVTGGEWCGPAFATPGECYFDTITAVEADQGV